MKIDRKIIKEAIDKEILSENPLAGPIAGIKGAIGGVKGTFQNMGANYRLSNVGSQMDQFAKKSKKAWDLNSKNAKKQVDKMMSSKNQDVAAAAQAVDQQLQQADQQIGQTLDFVSNGVARTMIAAGGGSAKNMTSQNNASMGTAGMERSLSSKGIYPKMIGKKEYLQVVELMQKINRAGGMQNLANFEREMVKKGIRPDRLGKREYGIEVISYLENEHMKLLQGGPQQAAQDPQNQVAPQNAQANPTPQVPAPKAAAAPASTNQLRPRPKVVAPPSKNNVGVPQTPINLSNKPAPVSPDQTASTPNVAAPAQHQGIQPTKKGYGVDKRFSSNAEPTNLKPQDMGSTMKQGFAPQSQPQEDDDSQDFEQIMGNIQKSEPFKRMKSWNKGKSKGFPKISEFEADLDAAPAPQEDQSYSSENEPAKQKVLAGNIQNNKSQNQDGNYFNAGQSQIPTSKKFSRDQLSQKDPRYMPYVGSGEAPAEPLPLTRQKNKQPPSVPPEVKQRKFPKVQSQQDSSEPPEKSLPSSERKRPESDAALYYKMLQKAASEGRPLKPAEMKDLQAWQDAGEKIPKKKKAPEKAPEKKTPTKKPRKTTK
jgi:hypothetical protein